MAFILLYIGIMDQMGLHCNLKLTFSNVTRIFFLAREMCIVKIGGL